MISLALNLEKQKIYDQALSLLSVVKYTDAKEHRKRILVAIKTEKDREYWLSASNKALETSDYHQAIKLLYRKCYDDKISERLENLK